MNTHDFCNTQDTSTKYTIVFRDQEYDDNKINIYGDDTVKIAEQKIAKYFKMQELPILKCKKSNAFAKNIVLDNIFRNKLPIPVSTLIDELYKETGKTLKNINKKDFLISRHEFEPDAPNIKHYYEPMSIDRNGSDTRDRTIESFFPIKNIIYVSEGSKNIEDIFDNSKLLILKNFKPGKLMQVEKCHVNFVHYRVKQIVSLDHNINMFKLYNDIEINDVTPFIKWISNTTTFFKVHETFAHNLDVISVWTKVEKTRFIKATNEIIVLKIILGQTKEKLPFFATVIVFANGMYDVKINFNVGFDTSQSNISRLLQLVNNQIKVIIPGFPLIDIENSDAFKIISSGTIENVKKQLSIGQIQKAIEDHLPDVFSIVQNTGGVLQLAYKRASEFCNEENAKSFMNQHSTSSKEELIKRISDIFMQTNAKTIYKEWKNAVASKNYFQYRKIKWTLVKFKPTSLNYKFNIDGATSAIQIGRIVHALMYAISSGDELQKTKVKKINLIDEEHDEDDDMGFDLDIELNLDDDDNENEDDYSISDEIDSNVLEMKRTGTCPAFPTSKPKLEKTKQNKKNDSTIKHYLLNKLNEADKDLFSKIGPDNTRYAKTCQLVSMRQPIVTDETELKYNEKCFQGAVTGSLKYGTSDELKKKNNYWCPKVWCPKSRVGLTMEQYKKYGEKCPFPGVDETAIIFDTEKYWNGDPRYVGFLKPKNHPDQFCMPCCFKLDKHKECLDVSGNEKYITSESFPMEDKRYGLLPKGLDSFFGNTSCGGSDGGQGLMNEKTNCFLRYGIPLTNQSFLQCVIHSFDNDRRFDRVEKLTDAITKSIDMVFFMSCGQGKLCKQFLNFERPPIENLDSFNEFKLFFLKKENEKYINQFNLDFLKHLLKITSEFSNTIKYSHLIMREYMFYNAYKQFNIYMRNIHIKKTHDICFDLVQESKVVNPNGYNLIVINSKDGKFTIKCSENKKQFNKERPTAIFIKQEEYYEPIHHVKYNTVTKDKNTKGVMSFDRHHQTSNTIISNLSNLYLNNCISNNEKEQKIKWWLISSKLLKAQILNYNLQVCGLYCTNDIIIPLKTTIPLDVTIDSSAIFIDTCVITFDKEISKAQVMKLIKDINKYLDEQYYIVDIVQSKMIKLRDCYIYIPLEKYNIQSEFYNSIKRDGEIFVGFQQPDKRKLFIEKMDYTENLFKFTWNEIVKAIKSNIELRELIDIMKHPNNPLTKDTKTFDLKSTLDVFLLENVIKVQNAETLYPQALKTCSYIDLQNKSECKRPCTIVENIKKGEQRCVLKVPKNMYNYLVERCIEDLLNPIIDIDYKLLNIDINTKVIEFNDQDIKRETLKSLLNKHNSTKNDYFANIIKIYRPKNLHNTVDSQLNIPLFINIEIVQPLPTFLQSMLKEFSMHTFKKKHLLDLFHIIQNKIHPENNLSKEQISEHGIEIENLIKKTRINCMWISRRSPENPDRVRCLGRYPNVDFFILLSFTKPSDDEYKIFIKNTSRFIFTRTDIPDMFYDKYVGPKCIQA